MCQIMLQYPENLQIIRHRSAFLHRLTRCDVSAAAWSRSTPCLRRSGESAAGFCALRAQNQAREGTPGLVRSKLLVWKLPSSLRESPQHHQQNQARKRRSMTQNPSNLDPLEMQKACNAAEPNPRPSYHGAAQHPLPHGPLAEAAIAGIQDVAARSTTHRQQPPATVSRKSCRSTGGCRVRPRQPRNNHGSRR
ncbi:unnamed protein product [Heligmosomoides polygyrus]|uniref:Uncharacterized protein n=1 Tax=Heligmosomoides polygyrus TaxID=6339 RepID=A0A183FEW0_HELPZ|nr:unnamed protein product [Heligmosomoides polygyrus]